MSWLGRTDHGTGAATSGPDAAPSRRARPAAGPPARKLRALALAALVTLVALSGVGGVVGGATAAAGNTGTIDSCTTIDSPGTYELTGNITNASASTCIEITANDTTLDGNGYIVDGVDPSDNSKGIEVFAPFRDVHENVTITNVTVKRWKVGIELLGVKGPTAVTDTNIVNTSGSGPDFGNGLYGNALEDVTVLNVSVRNVGSSGVYLANADELTLDGVSVDGAADDWGIFLNRVRERATVTNATVRETGIDGIEVRGERDPYSVDAVLRNVSVADASRNRPIFEGIEVGVAGNVTLRGATVTDVANIGIDLEGNESVVVNDTRVTDVGSTGVEAGANESLSLNNVSVSRAGGNGFLVRAEDRQFEQVANADFRNVTADGAGKAGILIEDTVDNAAVDNSTVTDTAGAGVRVRNGSTAVIRNITARDTDAGGVWLSESTSVTELRVGGDGAPEALLSFDATVPDGETAIAGPTAEYVIPPAENRSVFRFASANVSAGASLNDVALRYADADADNLDESALRVWSYDGAWTELAGSVDAGADVVTADSVAATGGRVTLAPLGPTPDPPPTYEGVAVDPATVGPGKPFAVDVTVTNDGGEMLDEVVVTREGTVVSRQIVRLAGSQTQTVTVPDAGFAHAPDTEAVFRVSATGTTDTANLTLVDADGADQPEWTGWHLPPENDNYDPGLEPPRAPVSLAWNTSVPTGFNVIMKPLVVDDTVYATTYTGTTAFDAETGEVLWNTSGIDGSYLGGMAYADGRLFVSTYTGTTALDAETGEVLWNTSQSHHLAPVVSNGTVFIPDYGRGNTLAVNATTGATVWNVSYPSTFPAFAASPAVTGGTVYAPLSNGTLVAHDAETGAVEWRRSLGTYIAASPAVKDGTVYVGDAGTSAPYFHALDAATGDVLWNATAGVTNSAPAVTDDTVYVATCGNAVYAYDADTGEMRWERPDVGCAYDISEPVAAEGVLYATNYDNETLALDLDTGETRYTFEMRGRYKGTSPVPYKGRLYVGDRYTTGEVYAFAGPEWPRVVPQQPVAGQRTELYTLGEFRDDPVANATLTVDGTTLQTGTDGAVNETFPAAGTYEVVVTAEDTARHNYTEVRRTVTVAASGLDARVASTNAPVMEGETLTVNATLENTRSSQVTQTVALSAGDAVRDSTTVTVDSGASRTVTFSWATAEGDAGEYLTRVATEDTTAYEPAAVQAPARFAVAVDDAPGQLLAGDRVRVNATVENTGDVTDTQTVSLTVGGVERDNVTLTLDGDESRQVTLSWATAEGDAGDYTATVASEDDSASTPFSVLVAGWPTFGANAANTGTLPTEGPTGNVTARWRFKTGDNVVAPATVVDGVVYIGSADERLYAIDAGNGTELWNASVGAKVGESPTVVGDTVYVATFSGCCAGLFAFHAGNGTERWNASLGSVSSGPTVVNGTVYLGTGGDVAAFDAETGTEEWNYSTTWPVSTTPAVVDGTVYVGSNDDYLYALDAETGTEQWSFNGPPAVQGSPAVVDGVVYVGKNDEDFADDDNVFALDADSGTELWSFDAGNSVFTSPAVAGGTVYVSDSFGTVYALDARDGAVEWQTDVSETASSPVVVDGVVYISGDEDVYALDAGDGSVLWNYTLGNEVFRSVGPPTVLNGTIYVGSKDNSVYALEAAVLQVDGVDANAPVREGETLTVNATVRNAAGTEQTQDVSLTVGGAERDDTSLTLSPGESSEVTLSWATGSGDAGDYTATVATGGDTGSTPVSVLGPPNLTVAVDATNAPVTEGETLTVDATVENTGDVEDTQEVVLSVGGVERDSTTLTLGAGESRQVSLSWATAEGDAGDYTAMVYSANDSATATVTVEAGGTTPTPTETATPTETTTSTSTPTDADPPVPAPPGPPVPVDPGPDPPVSPSTDTPTPTTTTTTTTTTPPPDASAAWWFSPLDPLQDETVTLVVDDRAPAMSYRWDVDGDGATEQQGAATTVAFGSAGAHAVTLQVVDENGTAVANHTRTVAVRDGRPNDAARSGPTFAASPRQPIPGETVTFVADPAVPSGDVAALQWDLDGDGATEATGRVVTETYGDDRDVPVSLTVERADGTTRTAERTLTVGEGGPAPTATAGTATGGAGGTATAATTAGNATGGGTTAPATGAGTPGFGITAALVAAALAALAALRRRSA